MAVNDLDPSCVLNQLAGQTALQSLTRIERAISGKLIARQMLRSPRASVELNRYGVTGVVQLYSATALRLYIVVLALLVSVLAVLGEGRVALALFGVMVLMFVAALARLATASRSGRAWRESRTRVIENATEPT